MTKMPARLVSHTDGLKKKSEIQQRSRRRKALFKKTKEYCIKCDADIYLIHRIRKSGQIYFLNSDPTGKWPPPKQLVCLLSTLWPSSTDGHRRVFILNQSENRLRMRQTMVHRAPKGDHKWSSIDLSRTYCHVSSTVPISALNDIA
jgi:SRF-type transcription factor (DNA-binding and dimerisation domain)